MWEEVARAAAADAGASASAIDSVDVVYCQSWEYDDAPGRLAARLGADPEQRRYSGIGGSVPQQLACQVATEVAQGGVDLALVVGAEALATRRRMRRDGRRPAWSHPPAERSPFPMDLLPHPSEVRHELLQAYTTFAVFDSARRAHLGHDLAAHRATLGRVMAPLTEVAAADPDDAWFPVARGAAEIVEPTPDNRMVAFPYTKLMTSIMDVDMAAAVLIASDARADALGVPPERRVRLRGWGYARDPAHVAARRDLWRSPAMAAAGASALAGAGIGIDDLAHLDLYSCFASSLGFAADALGFDETSRPLTVTGGLPYHGGPGSNYMTHSMAAMAERLRAEPGSFGMVTGVGMHMAKHVAAVWSTAPGPLPAPATPLPLEVDVAPIVDEARGTATVAAYTVLHGRDGPEWGALVCDVPDGSRAYARLEGAGALVDAEREELVGRTVHLDPDGAGVNRARL
jgi:acetyl-CoA C-acetyltransferase